MKWMDVAMSRVGIKEIPGPSSNQTILGWAKDFGGWIKSYFKNDDTPWCGLFVASCLKEAGLSDFPKNPLSALEWRKYGMGVGPFYGAVAVFKRVGGGHVGFVVGKRSNGDLRVLGGNQGNAVTLAWFPASRLLEYRWPFNVPVSYPLPLLADDGKPVSKNEG